MRSAIARTGAGGRRGGGRRGRDLRLRIYWYSKPEQDCCGQRDCGPQQLCASVVTCGKAAPLHQPPGHDLDPGAPPAACHGRLLRFAVGTTECFLFVFHRILDRTARLKWSAISRSAAGRSPRRAAAPVSSLPRPLTPTRRPATQLHPRRYAVWCSCHIYFVRPGKRAQLSPAVAKTLAQTIFSVCSARPQRIAVDRDHPTQKRLRLG